MFIRQYKKIQGPEYWMHQWSERTRESLQEENKKDPLFTILPTLLPKKGKALEVGVGLANWPDLFPSLEWYGVDTDPVVIERDKKELPALRSRLFTVKDTTLPFEADTFDVYCNFGVIEHGELEREFIREAFRVLRPGGIAIFTVPYLNRKRRLGLPFIVTKQQVYRARGYGFHQKIYTRKHIQRFLLTQGFVDVRAMPQGTESSSHMLITVGTKPK